MPDASSHPLRRIVEIFQRHGVDFLVIGGQAESMMGSPRVTYDVDFCYSRTDANIERLAAALAELKPRLRGAPPGLPFRPDAKALRAGLNFTFETSAGPLDLLGDVEPIGGYDNLVRTAEVYEVWGMQIRTIALEDLIRVKQHIARTKDSESLVQLLSIRRARKELEGGDARP